MLVSSRNCGSIRGLCAFVVCLFLAGEFRNLPVALPAGRKRAADFHAFPAERFHPPGARSPVPWPSRGIALEAAPLGCFPIGIPLPSPSSTLLPMYIRQVYTFLVPLAKGFPASRSPGTPSFRTEQADFFFRFRSCDRRFRPCRKSLGLRRDTSAPSRTVCVRDEISLRHVQSRHISPLHKQNAITILRPILHDFFHLHTRRAQLLNHDLLRNPMPAPVARDSLHRFQPRPRREINNRQPPSRLQRPRDARIELHRLGYVMVRVPQKNRVATPRRQIRLRLFALHHNHVCQLAPGNLLLQLRHLLRINLRRIHFSRRPHPFHRRKRVLPVSRPNVRRNRPRLPSH